MTAARVVVADEALALATGFRVFLRRCFLAEAVVACAVAACAPKAVPIANTVSERVILRKERRFIKQPLREKVTCPSKRKFHAQSIYPRDCATRPHRP